MSSPITNIPRSSRLCSCRYASQEHVRCHDHRRLGNVIDGGWDMCTVTPYRPINGQHRCLIYSFGYQIVRSQNTCSLVDKCTLEYLWNQYGSSNI